MRKRSRPKQLNRMTHNVHSLSALGDTIVHRIANHRGYIPSTGQVTVQILGERRNSEIPRIQFVHKPGTNVSYVWNGRALVCIHICMHAHMYVCIYTYIHIYIYIYIHVYIHTHISISISIHIYIYIYIYNTHLGGDLGGAQKCSGSLGLNKCDV